VSTTSNFGGVKSGEVDLLSETEDLLEDLLSETEGGTELSKQHWVSMSGKCIKFVEM
jgi:hypothetical protein